MQGLFAGCLGHWSASAYIPGGVAVVAFTSKGQIWKSIMTSRVLDRLEPMAMT